MNNASMFQNSVSTSVPAFLWKPILTSLSLTRSRNSDTDVVFACRNPRARKLIVYFRNRFVRQAPSLRSSGVNCETSSATPSRGQLLATSSRQRSGQTSASRARRHGRLAGIAALDCMLLKHSLKRLDK